MSAQLDSFRRIAAERPPAPMRTGNAVVVGSGKGGVGTSLLAALLGVGAAAGGASVLLIDGAAEIGSLHLLMGTEPGPGLEGLRGGDSLPEELVQTISANLSLLPAGPAGSSLAGAERLSLFRRLTPLHASYDLVIVDGGSRLDSMLGACSAGAARALVASTLDRIALTATYAMVKVLAERLPALPVDLLLNRADGAAAEAAADEVRGAVRHFLRLTVGYIGAVPDDECLHTAVEAGMNLQDAAGCAAAELLGEIGSTILRQLTAGPQPAERRRLQRRL